MIGEGIELHIKGISINWDKVEQDSYLREIDSIAGVRQMSFNKPVTFFVGENGSGKSTLLEAIAIAYGFNRRAEQETMPFQPTTPIQNSAMLSH